MPVRPQRSPFIQQPEDETNLTIRNIGRIYRESVMGGFCSLERSLDIGTLVLKFANMVMYAEAILALGSVGRVVPGLAALGDSTNAAQRQKRPVP